jgi:hypothetical protein
VPYITGQSYQLDVLAIESTLEIWLDGVRVFSVEDSSLDHGTVALYSWYNRGSRHDNVVVEDLANGKVLLSDDFNDPNLAGWTTCDDAGNTLGPSVWKVEGGELVQSSNVGSDSSLRRGTFAFH